MKTTIEIPDPLFRRAKSVAAKRGIALRVFVTEALAEKLRADESPQKPWMRSFGKLRHLHKETKRISELMRKSSRRSSRKTGFDSRYQRIVCARADGDAATESRLNSVERVVIPVIVLGEFRYGIQRSRHRTRYEEWLRELLAGVQTAVLDEETAGQYAEIRQHLKQIGRPIPSNDVWIAASARQHRLPIISRDLHFDSVAGLKRIDW